MWESARRLILPDLREVELLPIHAQHCHAARVLGHHVLAVFTDRRPAASLAGDWLRRASLIKRELYLRASVGM